MIARPDQYVGLLLRMGGDNHIQDNKSLIARFGLDRRVVIIHYHSNLLILFEEKLQTKLYSNDVSAEDTESIYGGDSEMILDLLLVTGSTNQLSDSNQSEQIIFVGPGRAGGSKGTFNIDGEGYQYCL